MTNEDGGRGQKYGKKNLQLALEGSEIILRIDTKGIAHNASGNPCVAGSPNPSKADPGKVRVVDLIATSGGFASVGDCKVSVNVTRE